MDLSSYTLPDLRQLLTKIEAEIEHRTDTPHAHRTQKKATKQAQTMVAHQDVTPDEALEAPTTQVTIKTTDAESNVPPAVKKDKPPTVIKYRNPAKPEQGWSGHGRRPQWVLDWLAQGKPIEDLAA